MKHNFVLNLFYNNVSNAMKLGINKSYNIDVFIMLLSYNSLLAGQCMSIIFIRSL